MGTDRNLIVAALAFRSGRMDAKAFSEICGAWSSAPHQAMSALLVARGILRPEDVETIEAEAERLADPVEGTLVAAPIMPQAGPGESVMSRIQEALRLADSSLGHAAASPSSGRMGFAIAAPEDLDTVADPNATAGHASPGGLLTEVQPDGMAALPTELAASPSDDLDITLAQDMPRGHILLQTVATGPGASTTYNRTKLHAKGGIGQVWLAHDARFGRDVALKELRPEQLRSDTAQRRFVGEARITGRLEHPGIVPVYDLVPNEGGEHPFYTMRFIRGGTLAEAIAGYHKRRKAGEGNPLEFARLLNAFVAVCNAIAYAHSRGVIHRDLKGQNIVLGDFGEVMVLDWGLAKILDTPEPPLEPLPEEVEAQGPFDRTVQGQILGTPAYMAPEQAEGKLDQVGKRTDVYGLGAILYEILAGRPPFSGQTTHELLRKVRETIPSRPRSINPEAPAALEAICLKAIAKAPEARYPLATDLGADVQRWLADEPVSAHREPISARARRWARRHRTAVATSATLFGALAMALLVGYFVVRTERDEAVRARDEARRQENRAIQQGELARRAAEEMYLKFAEYWMEDFLDPLQRQTLERAREAFDNFVAETGPGTDQETIRRRGRTLYQIGDIDQKLGQLDEAESAYQQSIESFATLSEPGDRVDRASILTRLGQIRIRRGDPKAALIRLGEAANLIGDPDEATSRVATLQLGRVYKTIGEAHRIAGRPAEAEATYGDSVKYLGSATEGTTSGFSARLDLAMALDSLGLLKHEAKQPAEAAHVLERARDIAAALLADFPTAAVARDVLAKVSNTSGLVLDEQKQTERARKAFEKARDQYQRLAGDFPLRPEYRRGLARAHIGLGNLQLLRDGRADDAANEYRRGLAIHEALTQPPDDYKYRRDVAKAYTNLGTAELQMGQLDEASRSFGQASNLFTALAAEFHDMAEFPTSLALLAAKAGDVERVREDYPAAIRHYTAAIERYDELQKTRAESLKLRIDRAACETSLGMALHLAGRNPEALAPLHAALASYQQIYEANKSLNSVRMAIAATHVNLGELHIDDAQGHYAQALGIYDDAIAKARPQPSIDLRLKRATTLLNLALYEEETGLATAESKLLEAVESLRMLAKESSDVANIHMTLGYGLEHLALWTRDRSPNEASVLLDEAIYHGQKALAIPPGLPEAARYLARQLEAKAQTEIDAGLVASAVATASTLTQATPRRADSWLKAARLFASAASRSAEAPATEAYGELAVRALGQASRLGISDPAAAFAEAVFDPIRQRDDFPIVPAHP